MWESKSNNLLLSSSKNGKILIFNVQNEKAKLYQTLEQNGDIRCLNIFSSGIVSSVHHGKATKWTFSDDNNFFKFEAFSNFKFCCFDLDKSFAVSHDVSILFGMNDERKTRILVEELNIESESRELEGHSDIITAILYNSKTKKLYSSGKDKSIIKWDIDKFLKQKINTSEQNVTGKMEKQIKNLHQGDIFTLEPICDFKFILSGGKDKQVKLVETESLEILGSIDTGMSIYGLVGHNKTAFYFGKNSKKIGTWNLESLSERSNNQEYIEDSSKNIKQLSMTLNEVEKNQDDLYTNTIENSSVSKSIIYYNYYLI